MRVLGKIASTTACIAHRVPKGNLEQARWCSSAPTLASGIAGSSVSVLTTGAANIAA